MTCPYCNNEMGGGKNHHICPGYDHFYSENYYLEFYDDSKYKNITFYLLENKCWTLFFKQRNTNCSLEEKDFNKTKIKSLIKMALLLQ
jgi:hypothetical protein